MMASVKIP